MKITKYKKSTNGRYIVSLEDDSKLSLYEETILEFNLLLTKNIDDIEEITNFNMQYEAYYLALKSINSRFKSEDEVRKMLKNKEYNSEIIEFVIDKLVKQGYLNDQLFAKLYINNQIVTTSRGPLRIKKDLLDKGVSNSIIDEELVEFNEDIQLEKIDKVINKSIKSNHSRGGVILKSKIFNDLKTLGYDSSVINKIINDYDYSDNKDLYKKEYDKLYRKLSKKYEGKELEYKVNERLYQKGLYYEK